MANKRYKILDGALDYLAFGTDATDVKLPANTPLRKFQEWRDKERKVTYDRLEASLPEELLPVKVNPFFRGVTADDPIQVTLSKRVNDNTVAKKGLTPGNVIISDTITGIAVRGYTPAKCTVILPFNDSRTDTPKSQLTGLPYKRSNTASYTFPYGRETNTEFEADVRAAIKGAFPADDNASFRFTTEKY